MVNTEDVAAIIEKSLPLEDEGVNPRYGRFVFCKVRRSLPKAKTDRLAENQLELLRSQMRRLDYPDFLKFHANYKNALALDHNGCPERRLNYFIRSRG